MLIRSEQIDSLSEDAERDFQQKLARHVKSHYESASTLSDETLNEKVRDGINKARGYEMRWQSSIADFVGLLFDLGEGFDKHPMINHILIDPATPADLRVDALIERIEPDDWKRIRRDLNSDN